MSGGVAYEHNLGCELTCAFASTAAPSFQTWPWSPEGLLMKPGVQAWPGFCTEISVSVAQPGGSNDLKVTLEGKRFPVAGDMEWIWSSHSDTALLYSELQGNVFACRAEQLWHTCRHQLGLVTHKWKGMQGTQQGSLQLGRNLEKLGYQWKREVFVGCVLQDWGKKRLQVRKSEGSACTNWADEVR